MTSARCLSKPQWLRGRCKEMLLPGEGFFPQAGSLKGRLSEHSVPQRDPSEGGRQAEKALNPCKGSRRAEQALDP